MTEVFKYTWLLLKEEPVYIALIFMITGTGVIFAYFLKNIFARFTYFVKFCDFKPQNFLFSYTFAIKNTKKR